MVFSRRKICDTCYFRYGNVTYAAFAYLQKNGMPTVPTMRFSQHTGGNSTACNNTNVPKASCIKHE